jgi:hypothetical protein
MTARKQPLMLDQIRLDKKPVKTWLFLDVFTYENSPNRDAITAEAESKITQVFIKRGISIDGKINHTCVGPVWVPTGEADAIAREIADILENGGLEDYDELFKRTVQE